MCSRVSSELNLRTHSSFNMKVNFNAYFLKMKVTHLRMYFDLNERRPQVNFRNISKRFLNLLRVLLCH